MPDFSKFTIITFDCYGTLIDWEKGILSAIKPVLERRGINIDDEQILWAYADYESRYEKQSFIEYKNILRKVMWEFSRRLGFKPTEAEISCIVKSIGNWKPFHDTIETLNKIKKKYKIAIISNIDVDMIKLSLKQMNIAFDYIITSEQVHSYKPKTQNFTYALKVIGVPIAQILHVAQSMYHDIVPAKKIGLKTVWVNRNKDIDNFGATPSAYTEPDFEVTDLKSLTDIMDL